MRSHEVDCFEDKMRRFGSYQLGIHSLLLDEAPPDLDAWDAFMVGGSGNYGCVNNSQPWFRRSQSLLRDIVSQRRPLFCSCFGHQALASALGGKVITDRERSELGTFELELTEAGQQDPLFQEFPQRFTAQLGHNDHVVELPDGAVQLARSERCEIQAYRLEGAPVYATQFHPEMSHLENTSRAGGYMHVYGDDQKCPKRLSEAFTPSPHTEELIPRFLRLVAEGKL